jgi:hypothetical protein
MRTEELRSRLAGVIAFPVTPFKQDLSLDIAGQGRNLQQLVQHPLAAVSEAGGTGELYSLPPAEHLGLFVYSREWVNPCPTWVERLTRKFPRSSPGKILSQLRDVLGKSIPCASPTTSSSALS